MSARIARGAAPRAKPRGKTQVRGKKGKAAEGPFSEWVRKASWWIFLFMVIAVVLAALMAFRVPQMIGTSIGESVGRLGFSVKRVEIKGLERLERLPV